MDLESLLDQCVTELPSDLPLQEKIRLIGMLGWTDDRRTYSLLMQSLEDEKLQEYVVKALAQTKDSRALFPLINLWNHTSSPVIQQLILQYPYSTRDPRAQEFLQQYLTDTNKPYRDIAEQALKTCTGNSDFVYRYAGSDQAFRDAQTITGQIIVTSDQLTQNQSVMEENQRGVRAEKPQTFIVDGEGVMYIGGLINEHVQVARGRDVKSAGEVNFVKSERAWRVEYINNRSNSYYPHPASFIWVKRYLDQVGVQCSKDHFDEAFPRAGFNDAEFLDLFK